MTTVAIDIGNTSIKFGIFEGGKLIKQWNGDKIALPHALKKHTELDHWHAIVASVGLDEDSIKRLLPRFKSLHILNSQTSLPIKIDYISPKTLGVDRICAAVAAHEIYPVETVLSIDMGTCITYDLVDPTGTFLGGGISPGYRMRLKAMHQFTQRLPEIDANFETSTIGKSTEGSIEFGALLGTIAELNGMIRHFQSHFDGLKVILTGGDALHFERHVENPIFASQNLVLEGLNKILEYNMSLHD